MGKSLKSMAELYCEATRAFVDYENYSREECVFYYRILERLTEGQEIHSGNYFISGMEYIIKQPDFSYKDIFEMRFMPQKNLSIYDIAEQLGITKPALLQRYSVACKYIRNQADRYDIRKRQKGTFGQLEAVRDNCGSQQLTRNAGLEALGLRTRAYNCLKAAGIDTVEQIASLSAEQIKAIPGVGPKIFEEIVKNQQNFIRDQNSVKSTEWVLVLEILGLDIRDKRCLNDLGVRNLDDFMRLTKQDVLSVWKAGEKTWENIYEKQQLLKSGTA